MFAKRPKSEGNNTTMAGIMDVQMLVKQLPITQRERENNKHSYETFQKYIQHSKEGEITHTTTSQDRGNRRSQVDLQRNQGNETTALKLFSLG